MEGNRWTCRFKMFSRIKRILINVTVEPINVLFMVGILSVEPIRQNFFLQTICRNEFPNSDECDSPSRFNTTIKDVVETKTTTYITIWCVCLFYLVR